MRRVPTNTAAWLAEKRTALEVRSAPYTPPRENEIVVKNHAVAINPLDWLKPVIGDRLFSWIKYPFVLGSDVAGEVAEVGNAVRRFETGDRVLGHAVGMDKKRNSSAEGAFQTYTVLLAHMAAPIPNNTSSRRSRARRSPGRSPSEPDQQDLARTSSTPAPATSSSPWPARLSRSRTA